MNMLFKAAACAAVLAGMSATALAQEADNTGSVMLRLRGIAVVPAERSTITPIGGRADATNTVVPEADVSYYVSNAVSVELIAAVTKHTVTARATSAGDVPLGSAWLLPPTLTAQYHFDAGKVQPYLGAGINYTHFFSVGLPKSGPVTAIHYSDSVGPALQAGVDIPVAPKWYVNVDVKKIWLSSDVKINGGGIAATAHLDPWIFGGGVGYRF